MKTSDKCIIYIGDFDFRNENVQSYLVKNNGKILNSLGYHIEYIGVNKKHSSFQSVASLPPLQLDENNNYFELPDTLSMTGLLNTPKVCKSIIHKLDEIKKTYHLSYVITYQSPTYAVAVSKIAKWCKNNNVFYIVNCADLPTFELQSPLRRIVMKINWNYLHKTNQKYAAGIIAVSKFIAEFYSKPGRASVIIPPLFDTSTVEPKFQPNDIPTFIYAGTPFKITGHEALLSGMKDRLDKVVDLFILLSEQGVDYLLKIVGITKEDYLIGVPRHKQALVQESKIVFMGRHSHSETLTLITESDFSVNYRDENLMTNAGFSTKIVESVSVGTPVIINRISDTFDYLEEGVSGFELTGNIENDLSKMYFLCSLPNNDRLNLKRKSYQAKVFDTNKYILQFKRFMLIKCHVNEVK